MRSIDSASGRRRFALTAALATLTAALGGCDSGAQQREAAESQVRRIADDLDRRTTETGVYIRAEEGEIKETDPWGTPLEVSYAQGGVAETVTVRSAGPDGKFHSGDDVVASGTAMNFKGVGEGIKKNAETTAANTAKGVVKGTVEGVKESIKDALPFKRTDKDEPEAIEGEEDSENAPPEPEDPAE